MEDSRFGVYGIVVSIGNVQGEKGKKRRKLSTRGNAADFTMFEG